MHASINFVSITAILLGTTVLFGDQAAAHDLTYSASIADPVADWDAGTAEPVVSLAVDPDGRAELTLVQAQPALPPGPTPGAAVQPPSTLPTPPASRRRRTYRLPPMFGDFYGGSALLATFGTINNRVAFPFGGGAVRRVKVAENNSAVPRRRFIYNYNFFNDVDFNIGDVNRHTIGIEQTFFDGMSSVEVRLPFGSTLDVDQVGGPRDTDIQFGDLTVILKTLLMERDDWLFSGGLGVTAPIAGDPNVSLAGLPRVDMRHESVHLLPFLTLLRSYDSGWYCQGFLQFDIDVNGNPVSADEFGMALRPIGVLQDQTLLFADLGVGYWLTGDPAETDALAVAATAEVHYATTLQDADTADGFGSGVAINSPVNRFDVVNLTLGVHVVSNSRISIRPAMVIPLHDDQFDFEAMVQMNVAR